MSGTCEYHESDVPCRRAALWEVQLDGRKYGFCDRHIRPEFHPRDLRKKLPGRIRRLTAALTGGGPDER